MTEQFDPFEDRLSRDLRNDLSEALRQSLETGDAGPFRKVAAAYVERDLGPVYDDYLRERLWRYEQALQEIFGRRLEQVLDRALVLWDFGLFFETHEVLEGAWTVAAGQYKLALQALIRAAGVYVHLEAGRRQPAAKMAAKAVFGLEENRTALGPSPWLDRLLASLRVVDPVAPRLGAPSP